MTRLEREALKLAGHVQGSVYVGNEFIPVVLTSDLVRLRKRADRFIQKFPKRSR